MKNLLTLGAAALVLMWAGSAAAGDYHTTTTLICSDCHVMHYSQSHGYNDDGGGFSTPLGGGPHEYLLRNEVNELCLTCHDNQTFAPDVFEEGTGGYVREAGALNDEASTGNYHPADGHTLGSTDVAPGGTWTSAEGLECASCHNPHGSTTAYRNLSPRIISGQPAPPTWAVATNNLTKDVYEIAARGYSVDDVWFNEPDATESAMAKWCKVCHTDFHGLKGGTEVGGTATGEWHRHPNSDANIGALGGGHSSLATYNALSNKVKVMSPTGVWGPTVPGDVTPFCLSCHKAHGNQNAFGLIFMSGTGTVTEEGDSGTQTKQLCKQCHRQG